MEGIKAREHETVESLLRRFRRYCDKSGRAASARRRAQGFRQDMER